MVSLEQRQVLASLAEADPRLKRFFFFISGRAIPELDFSGDVREDLLSLIASNDASGFRDAANRIGERRISDDSDWCQDDYLFFLLLLGNEKFQLQLPFVKNIIEVRRRSSNRIPRQINDVFAELERRDFRIEGDLCFLKIPFLHLVGRLHLGPSGAQNALASFSEPRLLESFSPFLKLLTQKAYDLIITTREPLATETIIQLIEGFELHSKNLSIRQSWKILAALPGRILIGVVAIIAGLGFIPFLFGVGKAFYDSQIINDVGPMPAALKVHRVVEVGLEFPPEIVVLAKSIGDTSQSSTKTFALELAPFETSTPPFVVEVSHQNKPIRNAFAYIRPTDEGSLFTIVPVQRDGIRFRAILPERPRGESLWFVLNIGVSSGESLEAISRRITLRPLK